MKNIKFLINTITPWDEPPRARHQVTFALAKKFKVAFVAANKVGIPKIEFLNKMNNIIVIQPYFLFDYRLRYRLPILNEIYQIWLFLRLKKMFKEVEIINFDFTAYLVHKYFKKVYYYCNDNFSSISKKLNSWPIYKYHFYCERKLAYNSKICVGISSVIVSKLIEMNSNSHQISLGGPSIDEYEIQPSPKNILKGTINIGLVGFIRNYNLSCQLLNDILKQIDCTITLIGPVEPAFYNNIIDKSRVKLKGTLKDGELLKEVNEFDVAIAPYLDRKISEGGIPNKLLIYLALGKPVVATELLSLNKMNLPKKMVYLVKNMDEFPMKIMQAQNENNWELIQQRVNYAKENTWDIRMDQFINLLKTSS
jgi:hypothetical protein